MRREHCTLGESEMPSSGTQLLSGCPKSLQRRERNMAFRRKSIRQGKRVSKAKHRELIPFARTTEGANTLRTTLAKSVRAISSPVLNAKRKAYPLEPTLYRGNHWSFLSKDSEFGFSWGNWVEEVLLPLRRVEEKENQGNTEKFRDRREGSHKNHLNSYRKLNGPCREQVDMGEG